MHILYTQAKRSVEIIRERSKIKSFSIVTDVQ
jgi:hypothetical protein